MVYLSNELLIRLLVFISVFGISAPVLRKAFKERVISTMVALVISILATVYISFEQLSFLNNLYGITGMLVLLLVPFIIVFYFIYTSNIGSPIRKIFWVLYGIIAVFILQNNLGNSINAGPIITAIIFLIITILLLDNVIKNKISSMRNLKKY